MRATAMEEIGKAIRTFREQKGLSQFQLARKVDVSEVYICGIEAGKRGVSLNQLGKICEAMGLKFWIYIEDKE